MKKLLYGLLGLLALVVAAALIGPSFVDWNAHKSRLSAEVRKLTGQDVAIDGNITLTVLPAPALSAARVRLANVAGGSAADLVELRELRVQVALMPLLQGKVQLEGVSLVQPTVILEILPDGRRNWEVALDGAGTPGSGTESGPGSDSFAEQIQVDSFVIEDGTVIYRDGRVGTEERVERINAEIVADSLRGPFTAKGDARTRGVATSFDLGLGRLVTGGATPFKLGLRLPEPATRAELAGSISFHGESPLVRGKLKSEGDDLNAMLASLFKDTMPVPPAMLAQTYSLAAEVTGNAETLTVADLNLQLGDTSMAGEVTIELGTPLQLSVALAAGQMDLDRALERSKEAVGGGGSGKGTAPGGSKAATLAGWSVPEHVMGTVDLAVEAVVFRGQVMRQVRLNAELGQGRVDIGQAFALLPGSSDISLTGTLTNGVGGLDFGGHVEAASDNLRGMLTWLGADLSAMPADRLRRTNLSSRFELSAQGITLSDIDLRVDLSRITGGVVIALRERLGLGIGLAVDTINLDAYLPGRVTAASGAEERKNAPAPPPLEGRRPVIERFDANLKLRVGTLVSGGVSATNLHLDGTLQDGALTLREASVEDLGGAGGRFVGLISELTRSPKAQGALEIAVVDPVRLAKIVGFDSPALEKLGPFDLSGDLHGNLEDVNFSTTVEALGGSVMVAGTVQAMQAPAGFDLEVKIAHDDLSVLADRLIAPGAFDPDLGPLALEGLAKGTLADFKVDGLTGTLGPVNLSGHLAVNLEDSRPTWTLDLDTGELPIAALMPRTAESAKNGEKPVPRVGTGNGARWSKDSLNLSLLSATDGDVTLAATALVGKNLRIADVRLEARLRDAVLDLTDLTGRLYDGRLHVSGRLDAAGPPRVELSIEVLDVDSAKLLQAQADYDRLSGPISLTAELSSEGSSEAALIAALRGSGEIEGTVEILAKTEEQVGLVLKSALGGKAVAIKGVGDAGQQLLSAFSGAPAHLRGSFVVEDGVLRTEDLRLEGRAARGLTRASADLPRWLLDSISQVIKADDPDKPYLTAVLKGQLDQPNTRIFGVPFQRPKPAPEPDPALPEPRVSPAEPETPEPEPAPVSEPAPEPATETAPASEANTEPEPAPEAEIAQEPVPESEPSAPPDPEPVEEDSKAPDPQDLIDGILKRLGQ